MIIDSLFGGRIPGGDVWLIFDFKNMVYRAANAKSGFGPGKDLCTSSGRVSGPVFRGFKLIHSLRTNYGGNLVFAFEGNSNFRFELHPDYKANRRKIIKTAAVGVDEVNEAGLIPPDYDPVADLTEMISNMKCTLLTPKGGEADDAIATFVKKTPGRHVVVSTDRDLYYLLRYPNVQIITWDKKSVTPAMVYEAFGVDARRLPMYKAIFGDENDNIPNIPNIGAKKLPILRKLINKSKDPDIFLSNLYKNKSVPDKIRSALLSNENQLKVMYKVAKLQMNIKLKQKSLPGNIGGLRKFLELFECKSLYNKVEDLAA